MRRRSFLAAGSAAALSACAPRKPAAASGLTPIRFATDWHAEAEHGGFYQALASGAYRRAGLDVRIIPGGGGASVSQLVASGAADLGIGSNGFTVLNLVREGAPLKAVMAVFQKDPQVLMAHPGAGVNSLADLRGDRPILVSADGAVTIWPWLKSRFGVVDAQRRTYSGSSAAFLQDRRAVQEGYVTSEPYVIEKTTGQAPEVFLLADQGYSGYATMVLAPDRLIGSNPKAVQAFVNATAEGWRDYLHGDPGPADALILKDNPEQRPDILSQAREKMRRYGLVESGDAAGGRIGAMTDARWRGFFDMAAGLGLYPHDLDLSRAYTLRFLGGQAT